MRHTSQIFTKLHTCLFRFMCIIQSAAEQTHHQLPCLKRRTQQQREWKNQPKTLTPKMGKFKKQPRLPATVLFVGTIHFTTSSAKISSPIFFRSLFSIFFLLGCCHLVLLVIDLWSVWLVLCWVCVLFSWDSLLWSQRFSLSLFSFPSSLKISYLNS